MTTPSVSRILLLATVLAGCEPRDTQAPAEEVTSTASQPAQAAPGLELRLGMRELWTEHVIWTRDYIVAAVAGRRPGRHPR